MANLPVLASDGVVRGTCGHDCPDSCAWEVTVEGGRAVAMRGAKEHPYTRGALCAKVSRYLDLVHHPRRVLHPLRRVGPKGEARFERVSWDEALRDIAGRLQAIIAESGAEAILPYSSAGTQGMIQMASLDRRLFGVLGASRLVRNICGEVPGIGMSATNGTGRGIDPVALVHSRYIVLWGTNTLVTNMHLWATLEEARRRGAKLVCIDPVRTRTAAQADWHLAPRPGTDAALALGMMHVIVRDGLVDHDYVARYATGYPELVERLKEYPPERVAALTGLAAGDVERLAREYATTRPATLRPLIGLEHHVNGAMTYRTLACLPVLTGAWRDLGGGIFRSTGSMQGQALGGARLAMEEVWKPGVRSLNMRDLGRDLCSTTLAPPVRALFVWNANPAASTPNQNAIRRGLARDDLFTVVHDLMMTDTARYADYVLPATSQIEHLDVVPAWGHMVLGLNRPAIAPRGEAVSNTELFRRLARALGRTEPFLFESDEALVQTALTSEHPWLRGVTLDRLVEEGWARLAVPEDYRPYANGGFATPSGKAELVAPSLASLGIDPLPHHGAPRVAPEGTLQLITAKTLNFLNATYADLDHHRRREGALEVELAPEDARRLGLADGQRVRVWNGLGELVAICRVSDRVRAGVAFLPYGGAHDADGQRRSANALTPEEPTDWGEGSGFYDAFVEVAPAPEAAAPAAA